MVRTSSKKRSSKRVSSPKYDVVIKAKATSTRIVDINNDIVRFESNDKGQVTGKHYSGFIGTQLKVQCCQMEARL
jgi:hypothetical protein